MFFKKITVPESNETKQVDAVQLWEVRWYAQTSIDKKDPTYSLRANDPRVEGFTEEQTAREFHQALCNAYDLTGAQGKQWVSIKNVSQKLRAVS